MLFGHHTIDKTIDEHLHEIAALASDPQTLIFLDTNILAYLYKLHAAARQEFFAWSDSVSSAGRLVVPSWAASEYLSRVTAKSLDSYTPKSREPSQAKKLIDALHETASLFVDDPLLGRIGFSGNRATYLTGFRQSIDALDQYLRAFNHQFDPGVIHQEIVDHLSPAILDSDLAALCARAAQEGSTRFEHRLPPGFRDGSKEENRFGDLIIWFEILDKAKGSAAIFPKVLFVTNDEKSDWVYAPKMRKTIVGGVRKSVGNSNPEIKVADPRLISEFQRKTTHPNCVICSLASLVEGLSRVGATLFTHLAAAIQINTEDAGPLTPATLEHQISDSEVSIQPVEQSPAVVEPPSTEETAIEAPPAAVPAEQAEPIQPTLEYPIEALQDSQYQSDAPSEINSIIRALKSRNWYTQNPAILDIRKIHQEDFPPSSWFVLGRNIYQAACGNSQKAMEFMGTLESQLAQFPEETAQHILAGILFEIYFDSQGQFREKAKFSYADKPLSLVANQTYDSVRIFMLFHLHNYRNNLMFLPGDRKTMALQVESSSMDRQGSEVLRGATHELRSVKLNGIELMQAAPFETHNVWSGIFGGAAIRPEALKGEVSEALAIPLWALNSRFDPSILSTARFAMPENVKLNPKIALQIEI